MKKYEFEKGVSQMINALFKVIANLPPFFGIIFHRDLRRFQSHLVGILPHYRFPLLSQFSKIVTYALFKISD